MIAIITALAVSIVMSLIYYFTGMLELTFIECWVLALSLQTVDTEQSSSNATKTMGLATNAVIILLI